MVQARQLEASGAPDGRAWAIGVTRWPTTLVYLCLYFALNSLANSHQFRASGITLWSPDDGLSLLLLMESPYFAPVVLVAEVVADLAIGKVAHGVGAVLASEGSLTLGYIGVAMMLTRRFGFSPIEVSLQNAVSLLALVPISAAATSALYCGPLYLEGALPLDQLASAYDHFWVGDTVGVIVVVSTATAVYRFAACGGWRRALRPTTLLAAAAIAVAIAVLVALNLAHGSDRHLFYVLFLPIIWIGVRWGYSATAIALLYTQTAILLVAAGARLDEFEFGALQTLMFILAATGLLLGAVVTDREHATRRIAEQQRELARVSAKASAAAMASAVAHEISQPLAALSTYVTAARRLVDNGQPSSAVGAALGRAEAEGRRARIIVERIRDFVASGRLELRTIDVRRVVEKIAALNRGDAGARGVALEVAAGDSPAAIVADEAAVEQALNNLVVNAIEAAAARPSGGGRVLLRAGRVGGFARLAVEDNGAGVATEIADRLFDPFETTKLKGMGLGLPLTLQIARNHSGRLTWRPLTPQGAVFILDLPILGPQHDAI